MHHRFLNKMLKFHQNVINYYLTIVCASYKNDHFELSYKRALPFAIADLTIIFVITKMFECGYV